MSNKHLPFVTHDPLFILFISLLLLIARPASSQESERLTPAQAEAFVARLLQPNGDISEWVDPAVLQRSRRLGIEYQGLVNKVLIQYDLANPIKIALRGKKLRKTLTIDTLEAPFSRLIVGVPEKDYAQQFYFRGTRLVAPADYHTRNWGEAESRYFRFRFSEPADFNHYAVEELDRFVAETLTLLEVDSAGQALLEQEKIVYLLCHDTDEMKAITGFESRGIYILAQDQIISTFNSHRHEVAHLLINFKLRKLPLYTHPFLQEGFACAVGGRGGKSVRVINELGAFLQASRFVVYEDILPLQGFQDHDPSLSYALSGLYSRFLLSRWTLADYLAFYQAHSGRSERARGKPLQAGSLPPAEEFARYVETFQLDNWIAFPDSAPEEAPLREGTWGGIWDLDDAYYFRIRSSLRLTPADPPVDFRSREFEEIFPGESYRGQMYLLEVKEGEIKLFNFYNAVLEAFFSNGLTTAPRVLRNAVGEYGFAISKKAFGRPLEEMQISE